MERFVAVKEKVVVSGNDDGAPGTPGLINSRDALRLELASLDLQPSWDIYLYKLG